MVHGAYYFHLWWEVCRLTSNYEPYEGKERGVVRSEQAFDKTRAADNGKS